MSDAEALVTARSLAVQYHHEMILRDVDLEIAAGEHVAVVGRSGSGKTTLLLAIAGLIEPTHGTVSWEGSTDGSRSRRSEIGLVFQAPSLLPELTAAQNVTLPLRLRGVDVATARAEALSALGEVSAADLADALPGELSGGQQQRVAVARALAGRHRLVLADEPTGALDRRHAREVTLALRDRVASTGGALVLATHDLELAELLDRRLVIRDGQIHEDGGTR